MKKVTEKTVEEFLIKAGHGTLPTLSLRKKTLERALVRRIVFRRSPYYLQFVRIAAPALLVLLVIFFGKGSNNISKDVAMFLSTSNEAVTELTKEERHLLTQEIGFDPADIISMIEKGKEVSFKEEAMQKSVGQSEAIMMAPAPSRSISPVEAGPEATNDASRAMPVAEDEPLGISTFSQLYATPPLPAVRFIRFTDQEGRVFVVGFDERSVPVSLTEEFVSE